MIIRYGIYSKCMHKLWVNKIIPIIVDSRIVRQLRRVSLKDPKYPHHNGRLERENELLFEEAFYELNKGQSRH